MAIHSLVHGETVTVNNSDGTVSYNYVEYEVPKMKTTFEGRVLRVYNDNYRAMSDVYTLATFAEVLTGGEGSHPRIERVLVNANFECDRSGGRAEVDATPQVRSIKLLLDLEAEVARKKYEAERNELERQREKDRAVKGKKMVVVHGRKVPVGTVGVVAFVKDGSALLKEESVWQNRNAPGTWVNVNYLKAV